MPASSLGSLFGAIAIALLGICLLAIPQIEKRRKAADLAKFGLPPYPPLKAGILNLVPGLGLWHMKASRHLVIWNISLAILASALIFLWSFYTSSSHLQTLFYVFILSGLRGEAYALSIWKTRPSPPSA